MNNEEMSDKKNTSLWDVFTSKLGTDVDLKTVKDLVENGADVNNRNQCGETVLYFAIRSNSVEITKYLVEQGANVNWNDNAGLTPLCYAVQNNSLDIAKHLVEHGGDVNWKDNLDRPLLFYAVHYGTLDIVKYLVEYGAHVNPRNCNDSIVLNNSGYVKSLGKQTDSVSQLDGDDYNRPILYYAVQSCSLDIVKFLVDHGADVTWKDNMDRPLLYYAVQSRSLEILQYLVEQGADRNWKDKNNMPLFYYAVRFPCLDIVKYLIEHDADKYWKDNNSRSLLHYAAQSRSLDIVKCLVEHGADVNWKDKNDQSPLYYAAQSGSFDIVKYLVQQDADVNWKDKNDQPPLYYAVQSRSLDIVKYLVEQGADVILKDKNDQSPLYYAVQSRSSDIVEYLLAHGADVNWKDEKDQPLLYYAVESCSSDIVKNLVEHGADVNWKDKNDRPLLYWAAKSGSSGIVKYLEECGAAKDLSVSAEVKYLEDTRKSEKESPKRAVPISDSAIRMQVISGNIINPRSTGSSLQDDEERKDEIESREKQNFFVETFLDSEYKIKKDVHEKLQRFSWLQGAYGIIGPNKRFPHPRLYLTVKRGKKKSEVLNEINNEFECDLKKYVQFYREPEEKPKFKYVSKPTSGGSIVAVDKSKTKNPLRLRVEREGEDEIETAIQESETRKASGTLTMFCAKSGDRHYALTCFHVCFLTDQHSLNETFNLETFLELRRNFKTNKKYTKNQLEFFYKEKKLVDSSDENENAVEPGNDIQLGNMSECKFQSDSDIMSIEVGEGVEVDCRMVDIGNPNWNRIWRELNRRAISDTVRVEKIGCEQSENKGCIYQCNFCYRYQNSNLFEDAVVVRGDSGTFLKDGDSGALVCFVDGENKKQAFAYGVCEVDQLNMEQMSSDEESDDCSEPSTIKGHASEMDESDSDGDFVEFSENGPFSICLKLNTALENLGLLDVGCYEECGAPN